MKVDLIEVWPQHLDYPLHRQFIRDNRQRFAKVIIAFTDMQVNLPDQRKFIKEVMAEDDITFIDSDLVKADQDWRNMAVNTALRYSDAEWVFFTEQDFYSKEGFWEEVYDKASKFPLSAIGAVIGGRLHPCCIFIPRVTLETTSKNFGIVKDKLDHFGIIQQQLSSFIEIDNNLYYHRAGLTEYITQELLKRKEREHGLL